MFMTQACGSSSGIEEQVARPAVKSIVEDTKCPEGTTLTYENFGESFLAKYCLSCHHSGLAKADRLGAPTDVNLDSYQDISTHRKDIIKTATKKSNARMPPSRHVPTYEKELLAEWLNCGAPGDRAQLP